MKCLRKVNPKKADVLYEWGCLFSLVYVTNFKKEMGSYIYWREDKMISLQIKAILTLMGLQNKLFHHLSSLWILRYLSIDTHCLKIFEETSILFSYKVQNSIGAMELKERRRQEKNSLVLDKYIKCNGQGTASKQALRALGWECTMKSGFF